MALHRVLLGFGIRLSTKAKRSLRCVDVFIVRSSGRVRRWLGGRGSRLSLRLSLLGAIFIVFVFGRVVLNFIRVFILFAFARLDFCELALGRSSVHMARSCQLLERRCASRLCYLRLGWLRAHFECQTLSLSMFSDMTTQLPRVFVYHFSSISSTETTEDLALADLEYALRGPGVYVSLVPTRHGVDDLS
jgi:hypothetical protein